MKNSVPPLLRTLRFCVRRQGGRIRQLQILTSQAGQQTVQSLEAVCRAQAPGVRCKAKGIWTVGPRKGSFRMTDHRPLPILAFM